MSDRLLVVFVLVVGAAAVFSFVMALLMALLVTFTPISCDAKWGSVEHRWGVIEGCQVRTPDGRWVPEEHWRYTES